MGILTRIKSAIKTNTVYDYQNTKTPIPRYYYDKRSYAEISSPWFEKVCKTKAKHYSLLQLDYVKEDESLREQGYEVLNKTKLHDIVTLRPNAKQTVQEFLWTFFYQLEKYGNALAIPYYVNGKVESYEVLDMNSYAFGAGYNTQRDKLYLLLDSLVDDVQMILPYDEVIHLRRNPNAIFNNDQCPQERNDIPKLLDKQLSVMLDELESNFDIEGVISVGRATTGDYNASMLGDDAKIEKANEIINRVQGRLLVLDAGEEYKEFNGGYKKATKEELDNLERMFYSNYGISKEIIDGTASYEVLSNFYHNELEPTIQSFRQECNYKMLTMKEREQNEKILVMIDKLSGAPLEQMAGIADKAVYNGWINKDEARSMFGWGTIPGGKLYTGNRNMANPDGSRITERRDREEDVDPQRKEDEVKE